MDADKKREEMMFRVMFNTSFIRSNILMLSRDEIDIRWDAKDRFPGDFSAELIFSEMDTANQLHQSGVASIGEEQGLPVEEFAKVQEMFSTVDWSKPKGDAAVQFSQRLTSPAPHPPPLPTSSSTSSYASIHSRHPDSLLGIAPAPENFSEEQKNRSRRIREGLHDECVGLDWHTRYKIIKGTWEGLKYLHEGFEKPIYHLDLKPDNILLDKNMVPKLADFGISKLYGDDQTKTTQSPIGTFGYLPPEYIQGNIVSNKLDIFSLGVVMIKIIAGPGGYSKSADMPRQKFLNLVHENWRSRLQETCQASGSLEAYCQQVKVCTEIALSCMEADRHQRPNIADIIHLLNDTNL